MPHPVRICSFITEFKELILKSVNNVETLRFNQTQAIDALED